QLALHCLGLLISLAGGGRQLYRYGVLSATSAFLWLELAVLCWSMPALVAVGRQLRELHVQARADQTKSPVLARTLLFMVLLMGSPQLFVLSACDALHVLLPTRSLLLPLPGTLVVTWYSFLLLLEMIGVGVAIVRTR